METHIPIKIITLQDQQNLHPMIEAQLDGKNIRLVIDTGASHSCLDKGLVKHLLKNKNKTSSDIVMGIGNKKMTNNIVTISELKLGDLTIHDYPILILKLTLNKPIIIEKSRNTHRLSKATAFMFSIMLVLCSRFKSLSENQIKNTPKPRKRINCIVFFILSDI
jgi:hypothetical protein